MRSFLPFAALLGVALVLGCQDVGTGPDGLVPQFNKPDASGNHNHGDDGDTTTFVAAITNGHTTFVGPTPTLTTPTTVVDNKFNTGNSIPMNQVDVVLSDLSTLTLTLAAFSVRKRQGKLVSAKVWVGAGGTDKFATDYLPAVSPVTISDSDFTIELHVADAEFVRLHDTSGTVAFTLNIDDIEYIAN